MTNPFKDYSADDRNEIPESPSNRTNHTETESASCLDPIALEGILKKIGQDCRKEPLHYLERSKARHQGE